MKKLLSIFCVLFFSASLARWFSFFLVPNVSSSLALMSQKRLKEET